MKATLPKPLTPALLQTILLFVLLIGAPIEMTFTAHESMFTSLPIPADPLYGVRASLIMVGLISSVLSVALLLWELSIKSNQILETKMVSNVALQVSITICSLSIGWAAFPYWVNGVFQGYLGNCPPDCYLGAFDPKGLMPMIWIGEIWRLGVMLIYIVAIFIGSAMLLLSLVLSIQGKHWKEGIATVVCLAITAAILLLSPGYRIWLFD